MSLPPIEGSVTIITGASSGIGREAARCFARAGSRVVLASRNGARLDELQREIAAYPATALALPTDVTDSVHVARMAEATLAHFGRIDIMICNAGVGLYGPVKDLEDEALRRVFEVNFFGVVRCVQAALPSMLARRTGLIQIISSIIGRRAVPGYGGYCATKFALGALAESLRVELAGTGVHVQMVYPGLTSTGFSENSIRRNPSRRPGPLKSMPAETVARRMLEAARSGRRDTLIGAGGHILVALNRFSPSLTDWILARFMKPGPEGTTRALPD